MHSLAIGANNLHTIPNCDIMIGDEMSLRNEKRFAEKNPFVENSSYPQVTDYIKLDSASSQISSFI